MRTMPQTEVRSLPALAPQETQTPSTHRGDGHNFSVTLHQKSAADQQHESPRKSSPPTKETSANDANEQVSSPTKRPPADEASNATEEATANDLTVIVTPVIANPTIVQTNPLTLDDLNLTLAMSAATLTNSTAENAKIADTQLVSDAAEVIANDVDFTATLPSVMANMATAKSALPSVKDHLPATPADDESLAVMMTPLVSNAPINSATPAAQTTGMNAVAAAIGDKKSEKANAESNPIAAKSLNDSPFAPLPAAPPTQTTVTRPMSETVMAQNTLAANGNAMEKALSHQVSKALIQHMPNGDRVLVMRLTPPELGTVKIEVVERMGVLTAKLHAEDDGVRLALERFLPSMRQDLRASDAPIRELSMSDQTQFQRSFADGQNPQQQQQNAESSNRRPRTDEPRFNIDGVRNDTVIAPRSAPLGGRVSLSEVNALA